MVPLVQAVPVPEQATDAQDRPLPPQALRPLVTVPDTVPPARVLLELRDALRHLARVVDRDGTTLGTWSFDDVVRPLLRRGPTAHALTGGQACELRS